MSDELIGGHYRVIDCLRKTGFCETYVAQDTHLPDNPRCVVKKLQPQSNEDFVLDTARRLFGSEAKVLYRLSDHPQIPRLLAHLEFKEEFYLVQEFIEGEDLSQTEIVPDRRWKEKDTIVFLLEVLHILAFVHQNRVIHRDIKPSNLIRRKSDGRIVLIDFGAVKEISNMTLTEGQGNLLTVAIGTPGYMASEQQRGDPRYNSDIYALGVTAIQAISGFHPDQLPRDRETGEINWRDRANCSKKLANILDRMVKNDFRERYQNANEVIDDLSKIIGNTGIGNTGIGNTGIGNTGIGNTGIGNTGIGGIKPRVPLTKRILWFALPLLLLGVLFLSPRVWQVLQAMKYYQEGKELIRQGEYKQAIDAFDQALAYLPNLAPALTNKGFAQGQLGWHLEKFASCAKATEIAPDFAEAWNCRGLARFDLKQYEQALKEYNQALAVDPEFYRGWYNKGEVLIKLGQYKEAISATHQVLKLKPDFYLAWTQICRALYELEQYQDAKAHCEESRNIEPDYEPTLVLLEKIEIKLDSESLRS